jgi:hypothetical protein
VIELTDTAWDIWHTWLAPSRAMFLNKLGMGFWLKTQSGKTRVLKKLRASIVDRLLERVSGVRLDATTLASATCAAKAETTVNAVARINNWALPRVARSLMALAI